MGGGAAAHTMRIDSEEDIIAVRRHVREFAEGQKFDSFATAAITTAASELARNALVHGGKGVFHIAQVTDGYRVGLRMVFEDKGPGIPDLPRALAGGNSTARTMGLGLSGSRRLVDEFTIDTKVGAGTTVTVTKWKRY